MKEVGKVPSRGPLGGSWLGVRRLPPNRRRPWRPAALLPSSDSLTHRAVPTLSREGTLDRGRALQGPVFEGMHTMLS